MTTIKNYKKRKKKSEEQIMRELSRMIMGTAIEKYFIKKGDDKDVKMQ